MLLHGGNVVGKTALCLLLLFCLQTDSNVTQDLVTSRSNTLLDDVDDTQRQLDNEVKERLSDTKKMWVIKIPVPPLPPTQLNHRLNKPPVTGHKNKVRSRRCQCGGGQCGGGQSGGGQCGGGQSAGGQSAGGPCGGQCGGGQSGGGPCGGQCGGGQSGGSPCGGQCGGQCGGPCGGHQFDNEEKHSFSCHSPNFDNWDYMYQWRWGETYHDCAGASQSPVNLPVLGLVPTRGARRLQFRNYHRRPNRLTLINNGKNVVVYGHWKAEQWPLVYGGAAHHRRYLFYSMTFFWPSEHTIGGFYYPMESQLLHISADYKSFDEAVCASSSDPQAFLGIVNVYKFNERTQTGLKALMEDVRKCGNGNVSIAPMPLAAFSPPFKRYVCYQGSLTTPPCTESVLWLVRSQTLPVTRRCAHHAQACLGGLDPPQKHFIRMLQPLNDRKIYHFVENKHQCCRP